MTLPFIPQRILATLKPPEGQGHLELQADGLYCPENQTLYPWQNQIPALMPPQSDPETNDHAPPYPDYQGIEEFGDLVSKGHGNPFTKGLLKAIGYNKLILECGCGTGQLSNYLQLNNNHVLGIDTNLTNLAPAIQHQQHNQLARTAFIRMDLFNLALHDQTYDLVIAHDVLHHTNEARLGFAKLIRVLKPGGIIMVGVYNRYARLATHLRANRCNPHASWHTIDELLSWFQENQIDYLNCSPPILDSDGETSTNLFAPTQPGNRFGRMITQLSWINRNDGGLFTMVGGKKGG